MNSADRGFLWWWCIYQTKKIIPVNRIATVLRAFLKNNRDGKSFNHWDQVKAQLNAEVIVHAIVHLEPLGSPNGCEDDYGFVGSRYKQVVAAISTGASLSLCEDKLQSSFNRVAELTANLGVCFNLSRPVAIEKTIVVKVDDETISEGPSDGWEYDSGENAICFSGTSIPGNGATVKITYYSAQL